MTLVVIMIFELLGLYYNLRSFYTAKETTRLDNLGIGENVYNPLIRITLIRD